MPESQSSPSLSIRRQPLEKEKILGVAIDSSGVLGGNFQTLTLEKGRHIYLLLAKDTPSFEQEEVLSVSMPFEIVKSILFKLSNKKGAFQNGVRCGWTSTLGLEGEVAVKEQNTIPVDNVFIDAKTRTLASSIVIGTLCEKTIVQLERQLSGVDSGSVVNLYGESICIADPIPDKPGGGIRLVA